MKIVCCGDIHLRESAPSCRTDDYLKTMEQKIQWIFTRAQEYGENTPVILPGDLFDRIYISDFLRKTAVELITQNRHSIGVAGQHDQRYHTTDLENTPIGILGAAGFIILGPEPYRVKDIAFYGASFGGEIPVPKKDFQFRFKPRINVLVIHKMISDKDYWNNTVNYSSAHSFLNENKDYDLIVSGDNHNSFVFERKGRILINCGSLMRSRTDQYSHKPMIAIYDTEKMGYEIEYVPIESPDKVITFEEKVEKANIQYTPSLDDVREWNLNDLATKLSDDKSLDLNFVQILKSLLETETDDPEVRKIALEALDDNEGF